jgi:hypothetical protein
MSPKNTPRDFFLHAGAFLTLYFSAIALLTLLFGLINYSFQDQLAGVYGGYYDPYSGPMRFAIASLIILVPITVYLFHLIQRETRKDAERRTLGVRKWLTYLTLAIAGMTVVGDLIVVLNAFLGGSLPTPFFLKVLAILAVMGSGFGYFMLDIRGYWTTHPTESRYVAVAVSLAVLVSIVGGMMLIGSPMTQRELRLDAQQVQELSYIQNGVLNYWQQTGTLPESMDDLMNDFTSYPQGIEGRPSYVYEKKGDLSFDICATFAEPSVSPQYSQIEPMLAENNNWDHGEGYHCFTRTIDPSLMKPAQQIFIN